MSMFPDTSLSEKLYASMGGFFAIVLLSLALDYIFPESFRHPMLMASMGASTFLLFVAPHSPMAQPWPLIGGHIISACVAAVTTLYIDQIYIGLGIAVSLSILTMYYLRCLHPPSAATAMITVISAPTLDIPLWLFCAVDVPTNSMILLILALVINKLIPGRHYPLNHHHHPHHEQFQQQALKNKTDLLTEADFHWALSQMDGLIDVSEEDLVDLYELAIEHAKRNTKI